jgi:branched-chain amino acid transport system permease protein
MERLLASGRTRWIATGVLLVVIAVVPIYATPYLNYQLSLVAVWAVAILGLNFISGFIGQLSLGQSAFVGIGAYAAVFAVQQGWPDILVFLFSCAVSGAVGLIIALPAARLRGHGFALVSLALPIVAIPLANRFQDFTGGAAGRSVTWLHAPGGVGLADDQWRFYVIALIAVVFFLFGRNFVRGKFGRALQLVRDDELVASANGIDGYRYRVLAFTMSSIFAGAAGFMYLLAVQYVTPNTMSFLSSLYMVAALVIGGRASVVGSLFGGVFYVLVPVLAGQVNASQTTLIYGAILLVVLFLVPNGLVSVPDRIAGLRGRGRSGRRGGSTEPAPAVLPPAEDAEPVS